MALCLGYAAPLPQVLVWAEARFLGRCDRNGRGGVRSQRYSGWKEGIEENAVTLEIAAEAARQGLFQELDKKQLNDVLCFQLIGYWLLRSREVDLLQALHQLQWASLTRIGDVMQQVPIETREIILWATDLVLAVFEDLESSPLYHSHLARHLSALLGLDVIEAEIKRHHDSTLKQSLEYLLHIPEQLLQWRKHCCVPRDTVYIMFQSNLFESQTSTAPQEATDTRQKPSPKAAAKSWLSTRSYDTTASTMPEYRKSLQRVRCFLLISPYRRALVFVTGWSDPPSALLSRLPLSEARQWTRAIQKTRCFGFTVSSSS